MTFSQLQHKISSRTICLTIFVLMTNQSVYAGTNVGTMTYSASSGGTESIPTLSGTMLIILSLLLFFVALRVSKQKNTKNKEFFISLIGIFALSSSVGGFKLVSDAKAGLSVQQTVTLTLNQSPTTGQVDLFGPNTNYFDNAFATPVTITAININEGFSCGILLARDVDPSAPTCSADAPNNIIPPEGQCQIRCFNLSMEISDSRLKKDIKKLSKLNNDIQLYSFKYKGENNTTYVGAMAQDLLQDNRYKQAVKIMPNNYYGVNYDSIGLKMISYDQWLKAPNSIYND